LRQNFGEYFIHVFSTIIGPNSFDVDKKEKIKKSSKHINFTFYNACPRDMSTLINKNNKPFCSRIDFKTSSQTS